MRLPQPDAWLARRAAAGDERAFATIYRRYHQDLYRFCLSILGRPEDAQDALQNTMVKALRSLPGEQREVRLKPWLYRVAHNESIDLLRRRREGPDLETVSVLGATELTETVAQRERLRQLLADLEMLPDRQRSGLVMRELAGLDYAQIAEAFETSPSVARQTVYEARVNLRELETGREMSCDLVTRQISEADGRQLRRRDIQAHLRACPDCRAFRDAIQSRRGDLAALAPLPALAAGSILQGLLGAGHGGAGIGAAGLGVGAGKAVTASAIVKSAATVAAVATIGVSAADRTGLVDVGLPGGSDSAPRQESGATAAPASAAGGEGGIQDGAQTGAGGGSSSSGAATELNGKRAGDAAKAGGRETHTATGQGTARSTHAAAAANGELPQASNHGQQTAASHGGGRAAAEAKAKGKSHTSSGTTDHPSPPAHPAPPSPKSETRPKSPPVKGNAPDNAPTQPLQPSKAPTEPGPPESAAGHGSKETR